MYEKNIMHISIFLVHNSSLIMVGTIIYVMYYVGMYYGIENQVDKYLFAYFQYMNKILGNFKVKWAIQQFFE